jgi:choline dehydrogenase
MRTIIVGAGSAGCIVAARLSEDADHEVVVLEAGVSDRTTLCRKPGMMSLIHMVPQLKEKLDWGYYTKEREWTLDRKIPYPRGKVLGGSGAINGLVYVRGDRHNYDQWDIPGWSYDELLPYFKKLENWEDGEDDFRGGSGPVKVTRAIDPSPSSAAFRNAVAETCKVPLNPDYNGAQQEGASWFQLNQFEGVRQSSSETYLHPAMTRPNLRVETGAQVLELLFEGSKVTGIRYEQGGEQHTLNADRVVMAAGAIGTPQLLMCSGIGPAAHLASHGISVRADLPVGQNLHDHLFLPMVFLMPKTGHTGSPAHFFAGMAKEYMFGGGWFGRSVFEAIGFVKLESKDEPDLQLHSLPWSYPSPNRDAPGIPDVDKRPALTVHPSLVRPKSRGELTLRSGNPKDHPIIDPHFLEEEADRQFLIKSADLVREIMSCSAIKQEVDGELYPGPDVQQSRWQKELPLRSATIYHPVGTCSLGTVVDPDSLKVRGFDNLYVADVSIMPTISGGNTNAPAMMIGEKAAALLRR